MSRRLLLLAASAALACASSSPERRAAAAATGAPEHDGGSGPAPARVGLPTPSSPTVAVRLELRTGSVDDPAGKEGLTALTAAVMAEGGTGALSASELVRALYPMAAELDAVVDKETVVFSGRCPRQDLERFLPILEDVVRSPRFDARELERLRSRALDAIEKTLRTEDDEELGKAALSLMLYGGHPYGHPTLGTVQGLKSITLDDVKAHWRRVFTAARLTVGAAGAYQGDLPARIARDLRSLPAGEPATRIPRASARAPRFLVVEKESSPTAVSMGFTWDVKRGDPDFPALVAAVCALGAHRNSGFRLYQELREERGLNYGDYAYPEHFVQAGDSALPAVNHARSRQDFTVWIRPVEPAHRLFAVRAALYEIDRWARQGLAQDELDRVKRFLDGYTLMFAQTDSRQLGFALDDRFYGLERPWLETLRERLRTLTLDEVNGAIRRHVDPARLRIVIATHGAAELAAAIRSGAPSPIVYAVQKSQSVLAADKAIERFPLGVAGPDDVRVVSVDDLFEK